MAGPEAGRRPVPTPEAHLDEPPGILVDSSVWIEYFRPGGRGEVREALRTDRVVTILPVMAEVVGGAPDPDALTSLLEDFEALPHLDLDSRVGARAAPVGHALGRRGRPAPAVDLMIAAAASEAGCELWHQDRHFSWIVEVTELRERWPGEAAPGF